MADKQGEIMLSLPADKDYVLLARMVLSGLGMLAGMDVGLIDDLRTATNECCDCLLHQPMVFIPVSVVATQGDKVFISAIQTGVLGKGQTVRLFH